MNGLLVPLLITMFWQQQYFFPPVVMQLFCCQSGPVWPRWHATLPPAKPHSADTADTRNAAIRALQSIIVRQTCAEVVRDSEKKAITVLAADASWDQIRPKTRSAVEASSGAAYLEQQRRRDFLAP